VERRRYLKAIQPDAGKPAVDISNIRVGFSG
jgi:hypothetical protein